MATYDRYEKRTAHGRGPGADERPEHVLGGLGSGSKEADRIMYLEQLRARIERGEYEVDVELVAGAVVERLEALGERLADRRVAERSYASVEVFEPK